VGFQQVAEPALITENGLSDNGEINDRDRIDFYILSMLLILSSGFLSVRI
jgi:beta-glucosidase/6-phospho-beta-glucosidase/beta-galactosidase